jgi:flagellar motor switch/type III secretory pathway protein FliN
MEDLGSLGRIPLMIEAVVEAPAITVSRLLQLEPGSLIRTNRPAGENVEIRVAGVRLADGDMVGAENKVCIRLTAFHEQP